MQILCIKFPNAFNLNQVRPQDDCDQCFSSRDNLPCVVRRWRQFNDSAGCPASHETIILEKLPPKSFPGTQVQGESEQGAGAACRNGTVQGTSGTRSAQGRWHPPPT